MSWERLCRCDVGVDDDAPSVGGDNDSSSVGNDDAWVG